MALTFPLSRADFFDRLPISSLQFDPPEAVELSQTGGGVQLTANLGPRLWRGEVTLGRLTYAEAAAVGVRIDVLREAGRAFMAYDARRPFPGFDPTGTILGAATPTIHALNGNNRELQLAGLPAGYRLQAGDHLSFAYGANPVCFGLHRVVDDLVTAAGTGVTPSFEVMPHIRPGAVVGAQVTLVRAYCKAILISGSVNKGVARRNIEEGTTFSFIQTLG